MEKRSIGLAIPLAIPLLVLGCASASAPNGPPASAQESPERVERPLDAPQACVSVPPATQRLHAWRERVAEQLDALTGDLADCFEAGKVQNGHQLVFDLEVSQAGAAVVKVRGAHGDVCPVRSCVERQLHTARFEPPPAAAGAASLAGTLTYYPLTSSWLLFQPGVSGPVPRAACVDQERGVRAAFDPSMVDAALAAGDDALRECYRQGQRDYAALEGTITTSFAVDETGRATDVEILANTLPDCVVVECVRHALPHLTFPHRPGGVVTVVHPLVFERLRELPPGPDRNRFMPVKDRGRPGIPEPTGYGPAWWEFGG